MKEFRKNNEIDIIGLLKCVFKEKRILFKFIIVSFVIGVVVALNEPKTYQAEVVLAPEISSGGLGLSANLSDMASSFGIDLGSKSSYDAIYPEIYPDVFASTDFIMSLFKVPVRQIKNSKVKTYLEHLTQDGKIPFWAYPKIWATRLFKNGTKNNISVKDPFVLSKDEYELCDMVRGSIGCQVDKKTSVITVSITDQDPLVAAIMADTLQHRLQEYITSYKTQKARNDFEYYKKLYTESKTEYIKAQQLYASYVDANQDIVLESFKSKQEELENEMQLKYNIYTQMSAQLQTARAKIQEHTPAFTIIERATMPYKASSTPRSLVVLLFLLLGFSADCLWILFLRRSVKKYFLFKLNKDKQ